MNPLETLLRPLVRVLNRNIGESTPARELCRQLDGKVIAVRVRDTGLAMAFRIEEDVLHLSTGAPDDADVILTGSLVTLARLAGPQEDAPRSPATRRGDLDITGDAYTAQAFERLLRHARPDPEEEMSRFVGDAAAHRAGEIARSIRNWAAGARDTVGANIKEYLQEEAGEVPSRYEVDRFARAVDALRDDVARLEARLARVAGKD